MNTDDIEPDLALVNTFPVRRAHTATDGVAEHIVDLLGDAPVIIDLSHHDQYGDTVRMHVGTPGATS